MHSGEVLENMRVLYQAKVRYRILSLQLAFFVTGAIYYGSVFSREDIFFNELYKNILFIGTAKGLRMRAEKQTHVLLRHPLKKSILNG